MRIESSKCTSCGAPCLRESCLPPAVSGLFDMTVKRSIASTIGRTLKAKTSPVRGGTSFWVLAHASFERECEPDRRSGVRRRSRRTVLSTSTRSSCTRSSRGADHGCSMASGIRSTSTLLSSARSDRVRSCSATDPLHRKGPRANWSREALASGIQSWRNG